MSSEQPLLRGLTTRGLPEGEDILFADHNTQTKPFMARPYLLHLHRKHPLFARKTLFKLLFLHSICLFDCYVLLFPALVFQLFILKFIKENVGFLVLLWLPCKSTFMETISYLGSGAINLQTRIWGDDIYI